MSESTVPVLEVTQEDIDASLKHREEHRERLVLLGINVACEHENAYCSPVHCPVSRAATRIFGKPHTSAYGNIHDEGYKTTYFEKDKGKVIEKFQNNFDAGNPVQPFSIELTSIKSPQFVE